MTVQRTWSGERAMTVAGLAVGAARIATGNSTPDVDRAVIPSGLVILLVGALSVELAPWRWARSVHSYFHGVPLILSGLAVALSRRYPPWLGWIGAAGGTASFLGGVRQFLGSVSGLERLVIVPAQVVSLWMVAMGDLIWRRAGATRNGG